MSIIVKTARRQNTQNNKFPNFDHAKPDFSRKNFPTQTSFSLNYIYNRESPEIFIRKATGPNSNTHFACYVHAKQNDNKQK